MYLKGLAVAAVLATGGAAMADYHLAIETGYSYSMDTSGYTYAFGDFGGPSPDTGFWVVTNTGSSTFAGTVGQVAVASSGGNYSYSHVVTLDPGDTAFFWVNAESSNLGGYNGPFGSAQPGVEMYLTGTITKAMGGPMPVDLHVFDRDIHSGIPATNPFGVTLDNYVLQGGDPFGRDCGDAFEVTQAHGNYQFDGINVVPLPPAAFAGLSGLLLVGGYRRFARK